MDFKSFLPTARLKLNAYPAEAKVVANFAWQHLKAATTFRDRVKLLENENSGKRLGDAEFFTEIRSYASGCILSAVASLEAFINELFIDPYCPLRPMFPDFEKDFWGKKGIELKKILEKYNIALELIGSAPLDKNNTQHQNAAALIELRNMLVHYKPTWDPDRQRKLDLIKELNGHYATSPFVGANEDFITMQSMSAGCTQWVVNTVLEYLREFYKHFTAGSKVDADLLEYYRNQKMPSFWRL